MDKDFAKDTYKTMADILAEEYYNEVIESINDRHDRDMFILDIRDDISLLVISLDILHNNCQKLNDDNLVAIRKRIKKLSKSIDSYKL